MKKMMNERTGRPFSFFLPSEAHRRGLNIVGRHGQRMKLLQCVHKSHIVLMVRVGMALQVLEQQAVARHTLDWQDQQIGKTESTRHFLAAGTVLEEPLKL